MILLFKRIFILMSKFIKKLHGISIAYLEYIYQLYLKEFDIYIYIYLYTLNIEFI